MAVDMQSEYTFDLSALDPNSITSSSTPRLFKNQGQSQKGPAQNGGPPINSGESAYSIHLSALEAKSASSTLNLDREITRLESEDIGGPSDFTQNLAEWMNGTKGMNSEEAVVDREVAMSTSKPVQVTVPRANTPTDWQALCQELQRKNDVLNQSLASHRHALTELTDERIAADAIRKKEERALQLQLEVWDCGTTRSLGDSATLGRLQFGTSTSTLSQRACTALVDQQSRIEELQRQLHQEKQLRITEARTAEAQLKLMREGSQAAQRDVIESQGATDATSLPIDTQVRDLKERDSVLEEQAQSHKRQHEAELKKANEAHAATARDVDNWVVSRIEGLEAAHAASIARRERKIAALAARNAELERTNTLCSKELMLAWGREECGPARRGEKQQYRYQHAVQTV